MCVWEGGVRVHTVCVRARTRLWVCVVRVRARSVVGPPHAQCQGMRQPLSAPAPAPTRRNPKRAWLQAGWSPGPAQLPAAASQSPRRRGRGQDFSASWAALPGAHEAARGPSTAAWSSGRLPGRRGAAGELDSRSSSRTPAPPPAPPPIPRSKPLSVSPAHLCSFSGRGLPRPATERRAG